MILRLLGTAAMALATSSMACAQELTNLPALTPAAPGPATATLGTPPQPPVQRCPFFRFIGFYRPDGKFEGVRKHPNLPFVGYGYTPRTSSLRPPEVPPYINLTPKEHVIMNVQPSYHATETLKADSALAKTRDDIVRFAWGQQSLLREPTCLTTDSRKRLIVCDPALNAVHVLDEKGNTAILIAGGPHLQLRSPSGVAVDAHDNIYIADSKRGLVLVFDPEGRYVRSIGNREEEGLFESPTSLGIDRQAGLLYVLDPPANELVILTLQGSIVRRVGNRFRWSGSVDMVSPSELAIGSDKIAVLDEYGSRVQVLDKNGGFSKAFYVKVPDNPPSPFEPGLALDSAGNIYVSNLLQSSIRVYTQDGHPLGLLGNAGSEIQQFATPSGMWIDEANRIYVADTWYGLVRVFQLGQTVGGEQTARLASHQLSIYQ